MADRVPPCLDMVRAALGHLLHLPDNLGIIFRSFAVYTQPESAVLVAFVQGLADEELLRLRIMEPLADMPVRRPDAGPLDPDRLASAVSAPTLRTTASLNETVAGILDGYTALFLNGAENALLVDTRSQQTYPTGQGAQPRPRKEMFQADLPVNIGLIRRRLKRPALVARSLTIPGGQAAILYLEGQAAPDLLRHVREFLVDRHGAESFRLGRVAGQRARFGGLPSMMETAWPDKAAALIDAGYVAVLVDRLDTAYIAPVTAPAMLYQPFDSQLLRPVSVTLRYLRVLALWAVLSGAAGMVALMNYHQEMMPTPFLLALASAREQEALPIVAAILFLEATQEVIREVGYHQPFRISPGNAIVAGELSLLLISQSGAIGPLPAGLSVILAFLGLGFLSYEILYAARFWRFLFIVAAASFGLFGIAATWFALTAYLFQARSFGVPFLGEAGLNLTAPGLSSSHAKGGDLRAT